MEEKNIDELKKHKKVHVSDTRKTIILFGVGFLINAIIALLIMLLKNVFSQTDSHEVYHILIDSFFVAGVITTCFSILIFASNEGTFDMLIYGLVCFVGLFKRRGYKKYRTYYDYKMAKHEKRTPALFLFLNGLLFIAISLILLIGFYD